MRDEYFNLFQNITLWDDHYIFKTPHGLFSACYEADTDGGYYEIRILENPNKCFNFDAFVRMNKTKSCKSIYNAWLKLTKRLYNE